MVLVAAAFLPIAKRTLKTQGLGYAAGRFVVISPSCDWSWRESPKPWVTELVLALRAADWIDHRRIYVTGCSMGGMSTWEVGARQPELYAAIAPVAGHHQADRAPWIARQLRETPVLVVHSLNDDTCPFRLEEPLWSTLEREGNTNFDVYVTHHIDHCSMYERAYCDDTVLYDWLLMRKRSN